MTYNPDVHKRRSIRLKDYDYSQAGAYFVTMCTFKKECLFGDIADGKMRLNEFGEVVKRQWEQTGVVRTNIELDEFKIMPNHFHAIIILNDNVGATRWVARFPETRRVAQGRAIHRIAPTKDIPGARSGSIGAIIGQFKSVATKNINTIRNTPGQPIWQRNYYEHIIRNEDELDAIRQYIFENPLKWDMDNENPFNNNGADGPFHIYQSIGK